MARRESVILKRTALFFLDDCFNIALRNTTTNKYLATP